MVFSYSKGKQTKTLTQPTNYSLPNLPLSLLKSNEATICLVISLALHPLPYCAPLWLDLDNTGQGDAFQKTSSDQINLCSRTWNQPLGILSRNQGRGLFPH